MVDRPQLGRVGVWTSGPPEPELAGLIDDLGFGALWIGRSPSGELAGIEQMDFGVRQIAFKRLSPGSDERGIVPSPHHQGRRLVFTQPCLPRRI